MIGHWGVLAGESVFWMFAGPKLRQPIRIREVVRQMMEVGIFAIPIVAMLAATIGVMLAVVAFLTTSVFLHASFIRYQWFLLALAAATARVMLDEPLPVRGRFVRLVQVRDANPPPNSGTAFDPPILPNLPSPPDVLEMDVNDAAHVEAVAVEAGNRWGTLDGVVHAIAFAPQDALGGNFMNTPWESVATAVQTSAYSLKALAGGMLPLMKENGGGIVSLDFDASVAWPIYDWMGVAKAGLEAVSRYLARDLGQYGIRVNCVSAGPLRTIAAKGIPGFDRIAEAWAKQAPLGWDTGDPTPVARAVVFLLSDWAAGITGEIVHVDGGFHAMGTEISPG